MRQFLSSFNFLQHKLFLFLLLLLLNKNCFYVVAWNVGEVLPITMHMRLAREATHFTVFPDNINNNIKLGLDNKKLKEFTTLLPRELCPRFAVNMLVHQPTEELINYTIKNIVNFGNSANDVAIRFQLGRGLIKGTIWMPIVKKTSTRKPPLHLNNNNKEPKEKNFNVEDDFLYLTAVNFYFGYQTGTFNKPTAFRAEPIYTVARHNTLELKYHWEERRAYNPHNALSICAFASVITSLLTLYIIIFYSEEQFKKLRHGQFTLSNHKD